MLAFTNTKMTKEEAVKLALWHKEQDSYLKGTYGKDTPEGWRGCSVGCMAKGEHGDYPHLFGIDIRVAYLSDRFFENLPAPDHKDWTIKLFESVASGVDTARAWHRFNHWLLLDTEHGVVRFNDSPEIVTVGELFLKAANGETVTTNQWLEAHKNAAYAVAATYADADAAVAAVATYAADVATYAAVDARTKHYQIMAEKLCYFLSGGV